MNTTNDMMGAIRLHFNIENPSIEDNYCFGYECAVAEVQESENPFAKGSSAHEQWSEGWWAGFYGEKPLFELDNGAEVSKVGAANDKNFHGVEKGFFSRWIKITGAIAASALVGYQVIDLVA